jgi:hypothetical protein
MMKLLKKLVILKINNLKIKDLCNCDPYFLKFNVHNNGCKLLNDE